MHVCIYYVCMYVCMYYLVGKVDNNMIFGCHSLCEQVYLLRQYLDLMLLGSTNIGK